MDDPFDTGLEDVSKYPTCAVCRKKSDAAISFLDGTSLCGTHFDEYMRSPEHLAEDPPGRYYTTLERRAAFVERLRTTKYASCWTQDE